jgi:hypothetical protein
MHIHTCLSPCGDWEMSPRKIVRRSLEVGLDLIAICDHNSAENAGAAIREGLKYGLSVLPGLEICSKEEVHLLAIFGELVHALEMQKYVYANLNGQNQPDVFGYQIVANEHDEVLAENPRLLIGATGLKLQQIVEKTHALEGLSISCHVDRSAYGIISQLGFIPPDLRLDGVEVSYRVALPKARETVAGIDGFCCVTSSDAHFLADIGRASTSLILAAPTFEEVCKALTGRDGRRISI